MFELEEGHQTLLSQGMPQVQWGRAAPGPT